MLRLKLLFPALQMPHLVISADPACSVIALGTLQARAVPSCPFSWDQLPVLQPGLHCSKALAAHNRPVPGALFPINSLASAPRVKLAKKYFRLHLPLELLHGKNGNEST